MEERVGSYVAPGEEGNSLDRQRVLGWKDRLQQFGRAPVECLGYQSGQQLGVDPAGNQEPKIAPIRVEELLLHFLN